MKILKHPSPNHNARDPQAPLQFLIFHYTATSLEGSLHILSDPAHTPPVSAHYVIAEEGTVYEMVDPACRAWHAGESSWRGLENMNSRSLGLEIVNSGKEPYPTAQITSVIELAKTLQDLYKIPPANCLGHADVAPSRKQDPGPYFPWARLASCGLGLMPQRHPLDFYPLPPQEWPLLWEKLQEWGYGLTSEKQGDAASFAALQAFSHHYTPHLPSKTPLQGHFLALLNLLQQRLF